MVDSNIGRNWSAPRGFTLIELSIVLVVIGLIVGGVLAGRDLVAAAAVRAQISQIEKYQQTVNTFRGKYGYLPGDIPDPDATRFGLKPRGSIPGQGDGNGVLEGYDYTITTPLVQTGGEAALFWVDLSTAKLLDNGFAIATIWPVPVPTTALPFYFPFAKAGRGNYVSVYSGGIAGSNNINYFSVSVIGSLYGSFLVSFPGLTVKEAYAVDAKMDDGLPQLGNIRAMYQSFQAPWVTPTAVHWASGTAGVADGANSGSPSYGATTAPTPGSPVTCYDNNNFAGATQNYSITQNGGVGVNCALSFKFQ